MMRRKLFISILLLIIGPSVLSARMLPDGWVFDRFRFGYDAEALDAEACYVLSPWTDASALEQAGFTLERYGYYTFATMR